MKLWRKTHWQVVKEVKEGLGPSQHTYGRLLLSVKFRTDADADTDTEIDDVLDRSDLEKRLAGVGSYFTRN